MSDKWIFLVYGSVKCVFLYFIKTERVKGGGRYKVSVL